MINRADKAALLPVQKIHSLAGIYTGVVLETRSKFFLNAFGRSVLVSLTLYGMF